MRRLIVTADDFGLSADVNEAVEIGHRHGILTSASLMVGAPAAQDAVMRARRMPRLRVGLHLTVVDGRSSLAAREVSRLLGRHGGLRTRLPIAGVGFFLDPSVRRQLARETRAQFEAFRATGLPLDHVDAHHHMHLHPTVAGLLVRIGRDYDVRAARAPVEPATILTQSGDPPRNRLGHAAFQFWARRLRARLRRAGLLCSDHVFGLAWTGCVTETRMLALLPRLPDGVSELFLHPSLQAGAAELAALTSGAVLRCLAEHEIRLTAFGDLVPAAA